MLIDWRIFLILIGGWADWPNRQIFAVYGNTIYKFKV